ncbi:MAG: class D beta-lactamase [Lentimicrobiaceae bacterium]|nr:class D beta-lactamase [Lentimicrobiaceae bacterium]
MKKNSRIKFTVLLLLISTLSNLKAQTTSADTLAWSMIYKEFSVNGTFVLYNLKSDEYTIYNHARAHLPYLPASTFKIMNTLIGLQEKSVAGTAEIFTWDGIKRSAETWNKDLTLEEAFRVSAIWVHQELARRSGREAIEKWLSECNYGNQKTGPQIDNFWLEGEIAISAIEQVEFLKKLYLKELPFDKAIQLQVKKMMLVDSVPGSRFYAKTGWASRIARQIGWFIGFIETAENTWIFAMNMDMINPKDPQARTQITRRILSQGDIYPEQEK